MTFLPDEVAVDQAEMKEVLDQMAGSVNADLEKFINPWGGKAPAQPADNTQADTPDDGGADNSAPSDVDSGETDLAEEEDERPLEEQLSSLAEEHGFSAEDMDGFTSVDEARRTLALLDRQTRQLGRDALYQQQQPNLAGQTAADVQFQQAPLQPQFPQHPQQATSAHQDNAALEEAIRELGADSPIVNVLRQQQQLLAQQQQQFAAWQQQQQQQFQQQQAIEQERSLIETVEYLQEINPQRYGSNGSFNRIQEQFLRSAINEIRVLTAGIQQVGGKVPTRKQLAKRVDDGLFFQENEKQQRLAAAKAGTARNGARLGQPSATKRKDTAANSPDDWDGPDEENPFLLNYYNSLQMGG